MFARFQQELEDGRDWILELVFLSAVFALAGALLGSGLEFWSFAAGALVYPATKLMTGAFRNFIVPYLP